MPVGVEHRRHRTLHHHPSYGGRSRRVAAQPGTDDQGAETAIAEHPQDRRGLLEAVSGPDLLQHRLQERDASSPPLSPA